MSEMIDRVETAIRSALNAQDDEPFVRDEGHHLVRLDGVCDIQLVARAVIVTMGEATDEMISALESGLELVQEGAQLDLRRHLLRQAWRLAIGAALRD